MTLPYIDLLLAQLGQGNAALEECFGRHIHWGYWPEPPAAGGIGTADYGAAAERLTLELCALAGIAPGMRVLDAGCGFGGTIAALNERMAGLELHGLNIDPRQLSRAAATVPARPGNRIAFQAGDACALPYADASFDRVLAVECVFHFPSRAAFLAEARRVLKPGGALVLSDFVPAPAFAPLCRLAMLPGLARLSLFGRCDVTCTEAGYRRLAAAAGLRVAGWRDITGHTMPTYDFLRALLAVGPARGLAARLGPLVVGGVEALARRRLLRYALACFSPA
jgi:SAM-dependent methyltransferase